MNAEFKTRLREKKRLIGTLLTLPSPEIAEICADAGFDWLFVDMEHGLLDIEAVQRLVQASGRCPCVVRVPENEEMWVKKALDTGAAGLIIPHVNTADEAARAVLWSKYPPEGVRSIGVARAQRYGAKFEESIKTSNQTTVFIAQTEHIEAVRNIESILNVTGVDAVFIGPYDLSASMGKPRRATDPDVLEAILRIRNACAQRNIPSGIYAGTTEAAEKALADGHTLVCCGMDVTLLSNTAAEVVGRLKYKL